MFYRSIRFKITILYMAILAITLSCFSAVLYHNVMNGLYSNMDNLLKSKASGITQAINTYWEASALESADSGEKVEASKKRRNTNFSRIAQRWAREKTSDPKLMDIIIQVFDTDGATIASSKTAKGLTEISKTNFLSVLQGNSRFDTVNSDLPSGNISLRIFTTPVFESEKVAYIVQVATPMDPVQTALKNLRFALLLLLPITVIVTGIMGSFLAKAALHPVDSMIGTIHQITAENMKLKISIPDTKDEVQKLAETFNDMLGRLERAFTSERQLFADLSHELKTPLTILKGEFEVILKKVRTGEEYEKTLRSSLEEINRIIKLVENLLILAKFDSKEAEGLERKHLDLGLLVQGAVNNIKGLSGLKDISVTFKSRDELSVNADEYQLKTLFLNILDNAIKYTEKGGKVSVSASRDGQMAKIEIRDTGVGIPPGELKHVFDRFYRGDRSRNRLGFGLGLSIARSIAKAHGGNITVTSRVAKGTAFTVHLPLS